MSNNSIPVCTVDPYKFLQLQKNSDGSFTRLKFRSTIPACSDPNSEFPFLTKDVPLNANNKTWVRMYLPKTVLDPSNSSKLPIIVYFHGGGFLFHAADTNMFHNYCTKLCTFTNSLVISVNYRLAPEHRLPAAFDDGIDSLRWIGTSYNTEEYLEKYGDLSNCFLMGDSAGATIAYKVGIRAATIVHEIDPLIIRGLILFYPPFMGSDLTRSEVNQINDPYVSLAVSHFFAKHSLPIGADLDHEHSSVRSDMDLKVMERIRDLGWQVLIKGGSRDPYVDRHFELIRLLVEKGVRVRSHFHPGEYHAIENQYPVKRDRFLRIIKDFISSCVSSKKPIENVIGLKSKL